MELTWLGEAEVRGMERERIQILEQTRRAVLRGVERRFGAVPGRIQKRVQAIDSIEPLAELIERLPTLEAVEDLVPRRDGPG